jgi:hypothetical protein
MSEYLSYTPSQINYLGVATAMEDIVTEGVHRSATKAQGQTTLAGFRTRGRKRRRFNSIGLILWYEEDEIEGRVSGKAKTSDYHINIQPQIVTAIQVTTNI